MIRDLLEHRLDAGLGFGVRHDHIGRRDQRHFLQADDGTDGLLQIGESESGGREIEVFVLGVELVRELAVLIPERRQGLDHGTDFLIAGLNVQDVGGLQQESILEQLVFIRGLHTLRGQTVGRRAEHADDLAGIARIADGHVVSEHGAILRAGSGSAVEQQRTVHARREEPDERNDDDACKNGKCNFSVLHQHVVHFLNDHGVTDLCWYILGSDENTKQ